jgi:predicted RNase H-like nuclease
MTETRSSPRNRHRSANAAYKHREDLIDALLCAWTASLRARHGLDRCQVLGLPAKTTDEPIATIIAPVRPRPAPTLNHLIPLSGK